MNPDATVVFDKAELAKAIHEEADAGPGGPDHFRQCFLGDPGDQRFCFTGWVPSLDAHAGSGSLTYSSM
jgi:hypothetical protein